MSVTFLDVLPGLGDRAFSASLRVRGSSAFIRAPRFIGRFCLQSGKVEWLIERSVTWVTESTWNLPRRILVSGSDFWISEVDEVVVEIMPTPCGGLAVTTPGAGSGSPLWERFVSIPKAAE